MATSEDFFDGESDHSPCLRRTKQASRHLENYIVGYPPPRRNQHATLESCNPQPTKTLSSNYQPSYAEAELLKDRNTNDDRLYRLETCIMEVANQMKELQIGMESVKCKSDPPSCSISSLQCTRLSISFMILQSPYNPWCERNIPNTIGYRQSLTEWSIYSGKPPETASDSRSRATGIGSCAAQVL